MMRKIHKIYPDKSLGQNFLIDKNVLAKIIAAAELKPSDKVIEIGAGTGVLTRELAKRVKKVAAFEIDKRLIPCLRDNVREFKNVQIVEEDILSYNLEPISCNLKNKTAGHGQQQVMGYRLQDIGFKIVANLPYNITSAVLEKFLSPPIRGSQRGSFFRPPSLMVLLVQREVAERICARPGEISVLSVMVQYYGKPEIIAVVPSSAFCPQPKVESAILRIKDIKEIKDIKDIEFERLFFQIVKAGFSRRRKMLKNNLKALKTLKLKFVKKQCDIVEILKYVGLSSTVRAQELRVEEWVKLAKELENLTTNSPKE